MKKLMIAAAAAAMVGGAFAGDGSYAAVYNLKYTLKTIAPKAYTCGKYSCTVCGEKTADTAYYYENGTVKIEGLIAYCDPCGEVGEDYQKAVLALWDSSNKETIYFDTSWSKAGTVYSVENSPVSNVFTKIDAVVYGKSSTKVAMDTKILYAKDKEVIIGKAGAYEVVETNLVWDLRATGLGTYAWNGNNQGYVKSVSGNVAGLIPAFTGYDKNKQFQQGYKYWSALVVDNVCKGAVKYNCVSDTLGDLSNATTPWCDDIDVALIRENAKDGYVVPAYGTWTMKFNSSATSNKNGLKAALPSWLR